MRIIRMMAIVLTTMVAAVSCGQKKEAPKVLVLYYSQTDNTKAVAQEIATALSADMEEVVPLEPYGGSYEETIQRCIREREGEILPNIQPIKANIAEELKSIASEMGIEGPHTSWWHMFGWNTFGLLLMGPAVATGRFFDTLNKIEDQLNQGSPLSRGVPVSFIRKSRPGRGGDKR